MKNSIGFEFSNMKLTTYWRLMRDQARKHDSLYDVTIMTSQGCNNFQLINLG